MKLETLNDEQRIIEGIASCAEQDRQGDVIVPTKGKFSLPLPLLWQHDSCAPIGNVIDAKVTVDGIEIRAQLSRGAALAEFVWASIKAGALGGLSIGFRALEDPTSIKGRGLRWGAWELVEISCVGAPANSACQIKSLDQEYLPARPGFHLQTIDELNAEFTDSETMTPEIYQEKRDAICKVNERRSARLAVLPAAVDMEAPVTFARLRNALTNVIKNTLTRDAALSARCAALETKKNQSGDGNFFGGSVERLEAIMAAPVKPIYDNQGKLICAQREMPKTKGEIFEALEERLKALEARPAMKYVGTYREGMGYVPGSVCTMDGSMWHAERTTTARPGVSSDWVLCVKHGRDLR